MPPQQDDARMLAQSRGHVRFLSDVAGLVPTALTRSLLSQRFADVATRAFCDICAVHALDGEGSLGLEAIADSRERVTARAEKAFSAALAPHDGFIQEAMRSGQPLLFERKAGRGTLVQESASRALQLTATRSLIVVPLSIGSTCIGAISFLEARHYGAYDVGDLECAHAAGRQLSVSFENILFREQEQRITERSRFLARATDQLFATTDSSEMLQRLLDVIVEEFADWALAVTPNQSGLDVVATAEADSITQPQGRVFTEAAERALVAAVRGARPLLVNEIMRSPAALRSESLDFEPRAWMMVPLIVGPNDQGGVVCYSTARRYDDTDLEMLQELSRRAALALEHAESFARERRLTQTLQQATLPTNLASIPGATISVAYQPAADEEQVGGDWYDAFSIDGDRVLLTVGDVTGHGLQASIVMAKLRHALNVVALYEEDPARVLDVAEQIVLRRFPEAVATAFVAILDPKRGTITYANAGHPCPIVRQKDGSLRQLMTAGLPIGLRRLALPELSRTEATDGAELLLFYTDGLTEARRDAIAGEKTLNDALRHEASVLVEDSADFVRAMCLSEPSPDDVAVLAVNFADVTRWRFASNDQHEAQQSRKAFAEHLRMRGIDADSCASAELIFGELAANVARHAPGPVDVALQFGDAQAVLHVIDRGRGYQIVRLRADALAEAGRGLWLVQQLGGKPDVEILPGFGTHTRVALPIAFPQTGLSQEALRDVQPA